jgi:hypothetical protein
MVVSVSDSHQFSFFKPTRHQIFYWVPDVLCVLVAKTCCREVGVARKLLSLTFRAEVCAALPDKNALDRVTTI